MRDLVRAGSSAILLLLMMLLGGLVLWIGLPVGWLYIGSQVEGATDSLGAALAVMAVGLVASIAAVVSLLGWLSRKHSEIREERGFEGNGQVALEGILVVSATLAVAGFVTWFLLFSGSSPIPFAGR